MAPNETLGWLKVNISEGRKLMVTESTMVGTVLGGGKSPVLGTRTLVPRE